MIVVDDGSAVPITFEIFGSYHERLKIVRIEVNRGAAAARQAGVDAASGDCIAFLDSDDIWLPNKLEIQVSRLEREPYRNVPVAIACGWRTLPEVGALSQQVIPRDSESYLDFASGCWFAPGSTLLIPRWVLVAVGPFDKDLRRLEDFDWFLRFALVGGALKVVPETCAIISIGRRSRLADVESASKKIEGKLAKITEPLVSAHFRHSARAYLSLEMAKAAQNQGHLVLMAFYMIKSLFLRPRLRLALKQWWPVRRKV